MKYQTRSKIVQSFIGKMDAVNVKDIDVIASLNHYVETGDESFFKEFMDFHFIKSMEERKELKEKYVEAGRIMKQLKEDYEQYYEDYEKWYDNVCETISNKFPDAGMCLYLDEIEKFARKFKEQKGGHKRRVFACIDGKLKPITGILWSEDSNKVVLTFDIKECLAPEKPHVPPIIRTDYEFEYFMKKYLMTIF